MLKVSVCAIGTGGADSARAIAALGSAERLRLERIKAPLRQQQFWAARWLLRQKLAEHWGGAPEEWGLSAVEHQAVTVTQAPVKTDVALSVALSHSGNWVACAYGQSGAMGLDIEALKVRDISRLSSVLCSAEEEAALQQLNADAQLAEFYRLWTLKEAWFKSRGQGIAISQLRKLQTYKRPGTAKHWQSPQWGLALVHGRAQQVVLDSDEATVSSDWDIRHG